MKIVDFMKKKNTKKQPNEKTEKEKLADIARLTISKKMSDKVKNMDDDDFEELNSSIIARLEQVDKEIIEAGERIRSFMQFNTSNRNDIVFQIALFTHCSKIALNVLQDESIEPLVVKLYASELSHQVQNKLKEELK